QGRLEPLHVLRESVLERRRNCRAPVPRMQGNPRPPSRCGSRITLAVAPRTGRATARGLASRASYRKPTLVKPSGPVGGGAPSLPEPTSALAAWVAGALLIRRKSPEF